MKSFIITLLGIVGLFSVNAQNSQKIDSMHTLLKSQKNVEKSAALLKSLFDIHLYSSLDSANYYRLEVKELSERNNYTEGIYFYHSLSGKYYFAKSELDSAIYHIQNATTIAESLGNEIYKADNYKKLSIIYGLKGNDSLASIYINRAFVSAKETDDWKLLSSIYLALGNRSFRLDEFPKALSYYLKLDSIYISHNKLDKSLAAAYSNIGNIYGEFNDEDAALDYFQKSIEVYQKLNHAEGIAYGQLSLGLYYVRWQNYQKAISHFEQAQSFYEDYDNKRLLIDIYVGLGICYMEEDLEIAEKLLLKAKMLTESQNIFYNTAMVYTSLGQLYDKKGYPAKAISSFLKTISLKKKQENNKKEIQYIIEAYKGLVNTYQKLGDYENALFSYEKRIALEDSIQEYQNEKVVRELNKKYQTEKKEQEIALLTSQKSLSDQQRRNQRNIYLGGIILLALLLMVVFILYRNKQKTNKKLKEFEVLKSKFYANITHEFRTPLTLISGPITHQLSKENLTTDDKNDLNLIKRNSDRLLTLINQLLELSKMEAAGKRLSVSKGDLSMFLNHLVEPFEYLADEKGIRFQSKISSMRGVWFDPDIIEKIISNMLSNAIKYCPREGLISFIAIDNGKQVEFQIKNTNTAISEKELRNIFDRFYQSDNFSEGVGIGLSLVKELVQLSKGSVHVTRPDNKHILFSITLPVEKSTFKAEEIKESIDELSVKPNGATADHSLITRNGEMSEPTNDTPILLVVDDNDDIRYFIKSLLTNDYRIIEADDGKQGVDQAIKYVPDLIISDIMMPVMDGTVLCETLKKDERTSHIPIILLTAKAGEENEIKGLQIGADSYLTKPFSEKKLKVLIAQLIETRILLQKHFSQEVILQPSEIEISSYEQVFLEKLQGILDSKLTDSDFNAEKFSVSIGMSRMQLHRKLKALTGFSTTEFIKTQRVKLASQLLTKSNVNISDIGYLVGFNQPAYFSTCFKEVFDMTPTEYAKQYTGKKKSDL